jgi:hypothetical protein
LDAELVELEQYGWEAEGGAETVTFHEMCCPAEALGGEVGFSHCSVLEGLEHFKWDAETYMQG